MPLSRPRWLASAISEHFAARSVARIVESFPPSTNSAHRGWHSRIGRWLGASAWFVPGPEALPALGHRHRVAALGAARLEFAEALFDVRTRVVGRPARPHRHHALFERALAPARRGLRPRLAPSRPGRGERPAGRARHALPEAHAPRRLRSARAADRRRCDRRAAPASSRRERRDDRLTLSSTRWRPVARRRGSRSYRARRRCDAAARTSSSRGRRSSAARSASGRSRRPS